MNSDIKPFVLPIFIFIAGAGFNHLYHRAFSSNTNTNSTRNPSGSAMSIDHTLDANPPASNQPIIVPNTIGQQITNASSPTVIDAGIYHIVPVPSTPSTTVMSAKEAAYTGPRFDFKQGSMGFFQFLTARSHQYCDDHIEQLEKDLQKRDTSNIIQSDLILRIGQSINHLRNPSVNDFALYGLKQNSTSPTYKKVKSRFIKLVIERGNIPFIHDTQSSSSLSTNASHTSTKRAIIKQEPGAEPPAKRPKNTIFATTNPSM